MPRCSECGLAFDAEAFAAGLLRENAPTRMDRCDLWQPHAAAWASVLTLTAAVGQPWRFARRVDVRGRVAPAVVFCVLALAWCWGLLSVAGAVGVWWQEDVSPALAVRIGGLDVGLRALAAVLCSAVAAYVAMPATWGLRVLNVTGRVRLRHAALVVPVVAWPGALLLALVVAVVPGDGVATFGGFAMLAGTSVYATGAAGRMLGLAVGRGWPLRVTIEDVARMALAVAVPLVAGEALLRPADVWGVMTGG